MSVIHNPFSYVKILQGAGFYFFKKFHESQCSISNLSNCLFWAHVSSFPHFTHCQCCGLYSLIVN